MVYELRIYDIIPTARQALYDRFSNGALQLIERHGIKLLAAWEPSDGRERLFTLYEWECADARERGWYAFRADPAWQALKAETEKNGPLLTRYEAIMLQHAPFFRPSTR